MFYVHGNRYCGHLKKNGAINNGDTISFIRRHRLFLVYSSLQLRQRISSDFAALEEMCSGLQDSLVFHVFEKIELKFLIDSFNILLSILFLFILVTNFHCPKPIFITFNISIHTS